MAQSTKQAPGSLNRGLRLLEVLDQHGELKLGDLPELLETSRATAFRLLTTLRDHGYVEHDVRSSTYRLGAQAIALGLRSKAAGLARTAEPALSLLRDITEETINLAAYQGGRVVYLLIRDGRQRLRMSGVVGQALPMHASALGKSVLAELPTNQYPALLGSDPFPALTQNTVTTMAALSEEIERIRRRGFAIDNEEVILGGVCVGAAISGSDGEPLGALSISGPAARISASLRTEYGQALALAASQVSEWFAHSIA